MTGVVPTPNESPESWLFITIRSPVAEVSSVAVGVVHVTVALELPEAAARVMSLGQEMRVGAVVSVRSDM